MNIGIVTYFAFRPHVEHLYMISKLIEEAGHTVFSLSCDGALTTCYRKELTKGSRLECIKCTVGGLRSYPIANLSSARRYKKNEDLAVDQATIPSWGYSSACTILRTETEEEKKAPEFLSLERRLSKAAWQSYKIAQRWIDAKQLDAIICFNGRMEATRGVREAAKGKGIRYISVERSMADGLLFVPEMDCLGLQELHRMVQAYRSKPITLGQAFKSAQIVAARFLNKNVTEWRSYNLTSVNVEWPLNNSKSKVLILPSSYNEYDGHPDWKQKWKDQFEAFDSIVENLGLPLNCFVMRGHPNWGERIGATGGEQIQFHYEKWAREKGIYYIPASSKISTQSLIRQADILIVNGGSAAIEAGILGKKIISLVETLYKHAGFVINYLSNEDRGNLTEIDAMDPKTIRRLTMRFLYTWCYRFVQYTKEIKGLDSLHYTYSKDLNADKLLKIISTGELHPDDDVIATDEQQEEKVLSLIEDNQWDTIYRFRENFSNESLEYRKYDRKGLYKIIDKVRAQLPLGDR